MEAVAAEGSCLRLEGLQNHNREEVRQMKKLIRLFKDEEGVVMIEYALIAALIGVALIVTLGLVTGALEGIFGRIISALGTA